MSEHAEIGAKHLVRWVIGLVLIWAGANKLGGPSSFFVTLLTYELGVPDIFLKLVAVSLPWLEVLTGAALIGNIWRETIRPLAAGLCGVFVVMLAQALVRGLPIECGCFGKPLWAWMATPAFALARALALFAGACWLVRKGGRPEELANRPASEGEA